MESDFFVRIRYLLAPAAALTLLLTGCAGGEAPAGEGPTATAPAEACVDSPSGAASEAVSVTGDVGAAPDVSFESPLTLDKTERTVAIAGDGDVTQHGDMIGIEVSLYNAATGKQVQKSSYAGAPMQVTVSDQALIPALVRAIECVPAGSRVVSVSPASDAWGDTGSQDGAVGPGEAVVIVADVMAITPNAATGESVTPDASLPAVALDKSGAPTVTIPKGDAPAEYQLGALKQGDGTEVKDGDTVTVQYQGVNWRTGEVFDQSWGKAPAQFATDKVIKGFTQALVGQKVGSQVIAVIPPELGYGEAGSESAGIKGTDTLVFVVDILATSR